MELNNKEKKIKQVLSDVNYDIDTDFLWKDVSKELDKKKRRRFLWFIPLFLSVGFGLTYLFLNYDISPVNSISETSQIESSSDLSNIEKSASEKSAAKSEVNNVTESDKQEQVAENTLTNTKTITAINESPIIKNTNNDNSNKDNTNNNNSTTISTSNTTYKPTILSDQSSINFSTPSLNVQKTNVTKLVEKSIFSKTENNSNIPSLFEISAMPLSTFNISRAYESIENDKLDPIDVNELSSHRLFLTIGAGVIRNINSTNTHDTEFANDYFDKQIQLPGVNASILAGVQTKNNWRFFGGFDYAQLVTRFKNTDLELIDGNITIDDQQVIDQQNSYQTTEGTLETYSKIENDITWHQYHNLYNIQLGVSKDMIRNNKLSIAPELSLIQNLYSSHSGYFFSEQSPHLTKFNNQDENPFRKNTGISSQVGINLAYRLRGIEFSINTAWRNPLNTITKETNFYQTKNSQLSTQVRVNYLLNWENK